MTLTGSSEKEQAYKRSIVESAQIASQDLKVGESIKGNHFNVWKERTELIVETKTFPCRSAVIDRKSGELKESNLTKTDVDQFSAGISSVLEKEQAYKRSIVESAQIASQDLKVGESIKGNHFNVWKERTELIVETKTFPCRSAVIDRKSGELKESNLTKTDVDQFSAGISSVSEKEQAYKRSIVESAQIASQDLKVGESIKGNHFNVWKERTELIVETKTFPCRSAVIDRKSGELKESNLTKTDVDQFSAAISKAANKVAKERDTFSVKLINLTQQAQFILDKLGQSDSTGTRFEGKTYAISCSTEGSLSVRAETRGEILRAKGSEIQHSTVNANDIAKFQSFTQKVQQVSALVEAVPVNERQDAVGMEQ